MWPLAYRLRRKGYRTVVFWHWPWAGGLKAKAERLGQMVSSRSETSRIHLVGHSLGGQIILSMLADFAPKHIFRVVTMGTPHMGSAAAHRVRRLPLVRMSLSRALNEACASGPLPLGSNHKLGTLAGNLNLFLGTLLGIGRPNDSVVAEEEARHPDASGHVLLMVSHGSMLVSNLAANYVVRFIAEGSFGEGTNSA